MGEGERGTSEGQMDGRGRERELERTCDVCDIGRVSVHALMSCLAARSNSSAISDVPPMSEPASVSDLPTSA